MAESSWIAKLTRQLDTAKLTKGEDDIETALRLATSLESAWANADDENKQKS